MNHSAIIERSALHERERIRFLEDKRGVEAATAFARRTLALYRRAVVQRSAPAGEAVFRLRFIGSYCVLKRYLHASARDAPQGNALR